MVRSSLFVPAYDKNKIEKALASKADAVILDLEDSVVPDKKEEARRSAIDVLCSGVNKPVSVRINDLTSPFVLEDVTSLVKGAREKLKSIYVPKIESKDAINNIDWLLSRLEDKHCVPVGTIRIHPVIETAQGVLNLEEIAFASPRIRQLAHGMGDLTSDLGLQWPYDGTEQLYVRTKIILVSRAAGLEAPLDTVWPDIHNQEGLIEDCQTAKVLGFKGKTVIHPAQIDVVNELFSPSIQEIKEAQHLLSEFEKAETKGHGAIKLEDGQFVDYAFLKRARDTVELAKQLGLIQSDFTQQEEI